MYINWLFVVIPKFLNFQFLRKVRNVGRLSLVILKLFNLLVIHTTKYVGCLYLNRLKLSISLVFTKLDMLVALL